LTWHVLHLRKNLVAHVTFLYNSCVIPCQYHIEARDSDMRMGVKDAGYEFGITGIAFKQSQETSGQLKGYTSKPVRLVPHPQFGYASRLRVLGDAAGQSANATQAVKGVAWLDHEWSSEAMAAQAVGGDWVGLTMADGGALMAFRLRDATGGVVWAGGTHRRTDGQVQRFVPQDVRFEVLRQWRSPHSGASYPVAMAVVLGRAADAMRLELKPLMDDQELDARASTGNYYWEGAVRSSALNTAEHSRKLLNGRGYLELTGYWRAQKL
jgi:hypothetical protein